MRVLYVVLQAIIGLAIIAVAWIAASVVIQDANKLPALGTVVNRAIELATSDGYREHIDASTSVLLMGLLPAVAGGILFGIIAGVSPVFRWLLGPLFVALAAVPLIALMPLLLLWFGLGPILTATAVAIITVFPVANAVMMSLASRQHRRARDRARPALGRRVRRQRAGDLRNAGGPHRRRDLHHDRERAIRHRRRRRRHHAGVRARDRDRGDPARDRRAARGVSYPSRSSSSIIPSITPSPPCQNAGSRASSPNGASSSA